MALRVAHGAQIGREVRRPVFAQHQRQLQVIDLQTEEGSHDCLVEFLLLLGIDQLAYAAAHQLPGREAADFVSTLVGVTDEPGGIDHQDQALGIFQYLGVEIALPLQLRLERLQLGNIQHQTAVLNDLAIGIAHDDNILQGVDEGAVFAAQRLLAVAQGAGALDCSLEFKEAVGRRCKAGSRCRVTNSSSRDS